MISFLMPSVIFIISSIIVFFIKNKVVRTIFSLLVPFMSLYYIYSFLGNNVEFKVTNFNLILFTSSQLSLIFAIIFHIFGFFALLYASQISKNIEISSGLFYIGSALGVIFSGDIFSFYVFWELLTFGAVIFIFMGKYQDSEKSAFRYLLFHTFGGLLFLSGIMLYVLETGNISLASFNFSSLSSLSSLLIFLGIGVNAGFPLFHTWIVDSYPKSSIAGGVFLSSLTTKVAIYALIKFFMGVEALIYIGAVMTIFPIFFAVLENDLRRVLSYSLINQLGFMVIGVGIGTELAINGTASHVFSHILYKSLLFMVMGALLYKYNTCKATSLGGLSKKLPLLTFICIVAGLSISAFPFFSGFVTKSMIITAVEESGHHMVWIVMLFASAAVVKYFKAPYCAFFGENKKEELLPSSKNNIHITMYISMIGVAILCIYIGLFPNTLYAILPYQNVSFEPYTTHHILTQLEIIFFATLALYLCFKFKLYPKEEDKINLDVDVIYRKSLNGIYNFCKTNFEKVNNMSANLCFDKFSSKIDNSFRFISKKTQENKFPIGISILLVLFLSVFVILVS